MSGGWKVAWEITAATLGVAGIIAWTHASRAHAGLPHGATPSTPFRTPAPPPAAPARPLWPVASAAYLFGACAATGALDAGRTGRPLAISGAPTQTPPIARRTSGKPYKTGILMTPI